MAMKIASSPAIVPTTIIDRPSRRREWDVRPPLKPSAVWPKEAAKNLIREKQACEISQAFFAREDRDPFGPGGNFCARSLKIQSTPDLLSRAAICKWEAAHPCILLLKNGVRFVTLNYLTLRKPVR